MITRAQEMQTVVIQSAGSLVHVEKVSLAMASFATIKTNVTMTLTTVTQIQHVKTRLEVSNAFVKQAFLETELGVCVVKVFFQMESFEICQAGNAWALRSCARLVSLRCAQIRLRAIESRFQLRKNQFDEYFCLARKKIHINVHA